MSKVPKILASTCKACGSETVEGLRPDGTVLSGTVRETALVAELLKTEEQASRSAGRVQELEQAIRAFVQGKVKAEVLGSLVNAEAY